MRDIDLRQIEETAREEGADRAKLLPAREIVIDERVRLKCLVPLCPSYGQNLMCPPNLPTVQEFRQMVEKYQWALLLQVKGPLAERGGEADKDAAYKYAAKLHQVVNRLERRLQGQGFLLAAGFIGGCCRLCRECVGQGSGEPCRYPLQARPSLEAMGINVAETVAKAGWDIAPFPLEQEVVWTGLILLV